MRWLPFLLLSIFLYVATGCGDDSRKRPSPSFMASLSLDIGEDDTLYRRPMPEPTVKMKVRNIGAYRSVFNDSNYRHWAAAESIGINLLGPTSSYWNPGRPIVMIKSNEDYYVEPLTYSRPYLVPEAAAMLREIGQRFRDTIKTRGGGAYRIKVTSLLRTPESVELLRRRNRNAIDSSVHQFGTTVDISYARYIADNDTMPRSADDLKGVLAEVLSAMRSEGKCYVKFERKQPCFHITVRPGAYCAEPKDD